MFFKKRKELQDENNKLNARLDVIESENFSLEQINIKLQEENEELKTQVIDSQTASVETIEDNKIILQKALSILEEEKKPSKKEVEAINFIKLSLEHKEKEE